MNAHLSLLTIVLLASVILCGCSIGTLDDSGSYVHAPPAENSITTGEDTAGAAEDVQPVPGGNRASANPDDIHTMSVPAADSASAPIATGTADIVLVMVDGDAGAYQFSVGISSPDTGCNQYSDWWEILDEQGELLYRRVITHSHVNEQPFIRAGGPVDIAPDTVIWVRAHMHPAGYGGVAFRGSVRDGFKEALLGADFAAELANRPPLPDGCAF